MLLKNLFEAIDRTGKGSTAVIGWSRGMGHKGHMMLASSVITKAKEVGGDPYFVVSRTVGKDDPITPEEKLAIYKKVFPEQGHIFQAASDEIPDLTRVLANLNQQGYKNAVVVVGADQVKAFQYLKNYNGKPDKSGNIAFAFDTLDVISRQQTSDPSAGEEGPRATPMRQVLSDLAAFRKENPKYDNVPDAELPFTVWRDAMSPELSDEEVVDLMNKAKERMAQFSKKKSNSVKEAEGLSKKKETEFHAKLDKLVHDTFGKRKDEMEDVKNGSSAIAHTAKSLQNPPKIMQHRAKRDQEREQQLKYRDIAKRNESINEGVDPKVSIVFDKYNPPDKDSIDGWKVASKTKFWMVGTNKVKKDPKNPLPHEVKLVCLETAMPRIKEYLEIVDDWLGLAVKAYKKYGDIELIVCTRHDHVYKDILKKNGHQGKHGYFKFDKITRVATPYYRHDKELKSALINKDKTAFKRASGVNPDKKVVAEHNRYEYFDLLEKFMIKRVPIVSLNESKLVPVGNSIEQLMESLIDRLKNK